MPNNRLWKKGLVVGIIVLFIGVGVYPAIAVKINTSTDIIDRLENKDDSINDISNFDFDKLSPLMFFSMNPKLLNSMLKIYSKIFIDLYKLSSKDCLEKINKMVKEKLSITLNILKIIESKDLIGSLKMKLNYENVYLKLSEISDEYNEFSSAFEKQGGPPIICDFLSKCMDSIWSNMEKIVEIYNKTDSDLVRSICNMSLSILDFLSNIVGFEQYILSC